MSSCFYTRLLCVPYFVAVLFCISCLWTGSSKPMELTLTPCPTTRGDSLISEDEEYLEPSNHSGLPSPDTESVHRDAASVVTEACQDDALASTSSSWEVVPMPVGPGDKKSIASTSSYVHDAAIRNSITKGNRNSFHKFPWEMNYMGQVFGSQQPSLAAYQLPDASTFYGRAPQVEAKVLEPLPPKVKIIPMAVRKLRSTAVPQTEDMVRNLAILKWRLVIESDIENSEVGKQIQRYCEVFSAEDKIQEILEDVFHKKSTATLYKRANSFLPFVKWCARYTDKPLCLQEGLIYAYVCNLRSVGSAATSGEVFKQSVNFAVHMLGLKSDGINPLSHRVQGVCNDLYLKKRKLKQAVPLTVPHVAILEYVTQFANSEVDKAVAGHLLFCLYSSCRWSDSQKIESLALEASDQNVGIIEATVSATKSATSQELKTRLLPLIALARGVNVSCDWGVSWIEARKLVGLGVSGTFLTPALSPNQKWLSRAMTTAEATAHLRDYLVSMEVPVFEANKYTSHSLKATALSWLAKYGVDVETRRLMGHHLHPTLKSVVTYSRDTLIHGHSMLSIIIDDIISNTFDPDASRDVMLEQIKNHKRARMIEVNPKLDQATSSSSSARQPEEFIDVYPEPSDSEDIADDELQTALRDAQDLWANMSPDSHQSFVLPDDVQYMQHVVYGTVHIRKNSQLFKCGRVISSNFSEMHRTDVILWPICEQCKPSK